MTTEDFKKISKSIPFEPGVYRFIDKQDTVIYVGKANRLRHRLSSYFGEKKNQLRKTRVMVKTARRIEYTVVETENDALLLEATLIKKFQPRYNVMLKDGKTYSYICIKNERFPRVFFTRRVIKDGSVYFGPYTSKYRANVIYDLIKNIFALRTCNFNLSEDNISNLKFKVCLEYHIKNCQGPCEGKESEESYNEKIVQIKNILRGNFKEVKEYIHEEMQHYASIMQFEVAQNFKEKLSVFEDYHAKSMVVSTSIKDLDVFSFHNEEKIAFVNYLKIVNGVLINTDTIELRKNLNDDKEDLLVFAIQFFREKFNSKATEIVVPYELSYLDESVLITIPKIGDKKKLVELAEKNMRYHILQKRKQDVTKANKKTHTERILKTMRDDLNMDRIPFHIECFDNSNIQGTNPVASCVVFKNAKPSKKDYRHFKIKTVEGPDDFASMEEVVYRRYRRLLEEEESLPQLIIIDGGKGQLSSAVKSLEMLGILDQVTVIGIAKRLEEIFFPGDSIPLYINKKSESLKVIQQARNEAHRFAINFHRNLRSKGALGTELTEIEGIGAKTAEKLLTKFKSVKGIKKASDESLEQLVGKSITKKLRDHWSTS